MFATMAALPPDPLIGFDYEAAQREGWTLSETCDLTGKPLVQLQALDQHAVPSGFATLLPSDRAAWDLVVIGARAGSAIHRDALARVSALERTLIETVFGPI
ncbi:MAG: hypothetical protein ACRYGI_02410 [Janthinobacterium lividum]